MTRISWLAFVVALWGGIGALPALAVAQRVTAPTWTLDSAVDQMTDKQIIWADLPATQAVASMWGPVALRLRMLCFTQEPERPQTDGLALRIFSSVSPNIQSVTDAGSQTTAMVRFDTAEAQSVEFLVTGAGKYSFLSPQRLRSKEAFLDGAYDYNEARDTLVRRVLRASRLRLQLQLITDEWIIAEFRFDPSTRRALGRIFKACMQDVP